jgi:hypothetical protein
MAFLIWTNEEADEAIDLGDPFALMSAMQEIGDAIGDDTDEYKQLGEVLDMGEQEVDDEWLAMVRKQAKRCLDEYDLGDHARWVLEQLASGKT